MNEPLRIVMTIDNALDAEVANSQELFIKREDCKTEEEWKEIVKVSKAKLRNIAKLHRLARWYFRQLKEEHRQQWFGVLPMSDPLYKKYKAQYEMKKGKS